MKKLNLGCYDDIKKGYVNLDQEKYFPGIDVAHNLEEFPYPFKDNTFDEVYAHFVLEHISANNTEKVLEELHRICKSSALIKIFVPYGTNWVRNIDHKRGFNFFTFNSLTREKNLAEWQNKYQFGLHNMEGLPTQLGKLIPNFKIPFTYSMKRKGKVVFKFGLRDMLSMFINSIVRDIYVELRVLKK